MKKFTFLKFAAMTIALVFGSNAAATVLLTENFDYTAASPLATNNGWKSFILQTGTEKSTATVDVTVVDGALQYPDYLSTNVGKSIQLDGLNKDVYKVFPHIDGVTTEAFSSGASVGGRFTTADGSVYASLLVNVERPFDGIGDTKGDCFFGFGANNWAIGAAGRIYTRKLGSGFQFGITRVGNAKVVWDPTERSLGTTYLLIVKYTIKTGDKNDRVYLAINPTLGLTEPTWIANDATDANAELGNLVGAVQFLQKINTSSTDPKAVQSKMKVGGLRVATTWEEVGDVNPNTAINKLDQSELRVVAQNGTLKVSGANGRLVEVFNSVGKKIASAQSSDKITEIAISTKGMVLVKIGSSVKKVML